MIPADAPRPSIAPSSATASFPPGRPYVRPRLVPVRGGPDHGFPRPGPDLPRRGHDRRNTRATSVDNLDITAGRYWSARNSFAVLPALFTWADASPIDYEWLVPAEGTEFAERHWIWSAESFRRNRYAQIHAFDIELEVAIGLYAELGYSPGETIDFLLGLLTIDIAGDDGRF